MGQKKITTRRSFIGNTARASVATVAGISVLKITGDDLNPGPRQPFATGFRQEPLPYEYSALDKAIDALTMEIHYTRHAAAYSTNVQDAAKAEGVDITRPLEEVLGKISKYSAKMRNNGGGHFNHEFFWKSMSPNSSEKPSGKLASAIEQGFGSFEAFKTQFTDAGKNRFGSGWAWLYLDGDKKLKIGSTPNQDNPLMDISDIKGWPILGLDVWEHAYYLRYQNKRPDYIANWWKVVNWEVVQQRFETMG